MFNLCLSYKWQIPHESDFNVCRQSEKKTPSKHFHSVIHTGDLYRGAQADTNTHTIAFWYVEKIQAARRQFDLKISQAKKLFWLVFLLLLSAERFASTAPNDGMRFCV